MEGITYFQYRISDTNIEFAYETGAEYKFLVLDVLLHKKGNKILTNI